VDNKDQRPVVLAVDDTPQNLDVVKGILTPEYRIKVATNGPAALRIVEKQLPDIILLDIMMPGMSGLEVCRELKANPRSADVPVIFLTAKDQTEDETEGFELGAADYILKPVNPPILQARVKTHLALKQSMDALQETSAALARAKQRMELELNVGRDIQTSMLPSVVPERKEVTLSASMETAREVGGDFYDYYMLNENELCFCVADVSGKGVPAALFMGMSKILIRSSARDERDPAKVITRVNEELSEDNPECMFVTVFLGVLNLSTGELTYTNGGHNPPLIRRASGEVEALSDIHGPVVAIMPGEEYEQSTLQMEPGDVLLVFTDGVTEAMDLDRNLYGDDRLFDVLKAMPDCGAQAVVNCVNESVAAFAAGAEQADDITMLAVQYNEHSALTT
jgi:sigma-B regulation protein RsbU (phosphoserine phosphatase)